jgi:hypothetical protein
MGVFKVFGKVTGGLLAVAGAVGLGISAIYWFDLDDKMVAKTDEFMDKAGKLKEMKRMKEEYEAQQTAESA